MVRTLLADPYVTFRHGSGPRGGITGMTTTTPDRRAADSPDRRAADLHATEPLEAASVRSPRVLRDGVAFEPPAPGRYLVIEDGNVAQLVALRRPIMHVGRGFAVDLRLEDQSVSRRHAILVERDGETRILDDRSANGTFVNGHRVAEAPLRDRDVIRIGRVVLVYVDIAG
jgi:FHA domain-containing protein